MLLALRLRGTGCGTSCEVSIELTCWVMGLCACLGETLVELGALAADDLEQVAGLLSSSGGQTARTSTTITPLCVLVLTGERPVAAWLALVVIG